MQAVSALQWETLTAVVPARRQQSASLPAMKTKPIIQFCCAKGLPETNKEYAPLHSRCSRVEKLLSKHFSLGLTRKNSLADCALNKKKKRNELEHALNPSKLLLFSLEALAIFCFKCCYALYNLSINFTWCISWFPFTVTHICGWVRILCRTRSSFTLPAISLSLGQLEA